MLGKTGLPPRNGGQTFNEAFVSSMSQSPPRIPEQLSRCQRLLRQVAPSGTWMDPIAHLGVGGRGDFGRIKGFWLRNC